MLSCIARLFPIPISTNLYLSIPHISKSKHFREKERERERVMKKEVLQQQHSQKFWSKMELPQLSLASTPQQRAACSSSSVSETNVHNPCKKRKQSLSTNHYLFEDNHQTSVVDLQLKDPLPLDWERCLDLKSGRVHYLNKKTLQKSWDSPTDQQHHQKLDLELKVSPFSSPTYNSDVDNNNWCCESKSLKDSSGSSNNMVALACLNCHLLVILSKSYPSCPNCKFVHSLSTQHVSLSPHKNTNNVNTLDTLSLLN